jgi:prolyl-tRNA synthetase
MQLREAIEESEKMMNVMLICRKFHGYSSCKGLKTETKRFAGAEETYCIEALMQDGKALQAGTSTLGQNFAKALM